MATRITIGCDPELFFRDKKTGSLISAHTLIPGTKVEPYKVTAGAIQVDGAAAEFNTDPADNHLTFVTNIRQVMTELRERAKGVDFVLEPTATFEPTYFSSLPDEVRELGCNPDFNAWTGEVNPPPDGDSTTMRTASGHIHIGWHKNLVNPQDPLHFDDCRTVVKQLDYYVGLYSLLWDPDNKRRQLYGKAGAFRPKPYGVEYRTPSNVWLRSEGIQTWIFNSALSAVNHLLSGKVSMEKQFGEYARECIDNNVVDWNKTDKGNKIHYATGLNWPDVRKCLEYGKSVAAATAEKPKQKRSANFYANTSAKALLQNDGTNTAAPDAWNILVNG